MPNFNVSFTRTVEQAGTFSVTAKNQEAAERKADKIIKRLLELDTTDKINAVLIDNDGTELEVDCEDISIDSVDEE